MSLKPISSVSTLDVHSKRIKNWYQNHARTPNISKGKKKDVDIFKYTGRTVRAKPTEWQKYLSMYYPIKFRDEVQTLYQSALREYAIKWATLSGDARKELKEPSRLAIMCHVAREHYKDESEEVKTEVRAAVRRAMEKFEREGGGDKGMIERRKT